MPIPLGILAVAGAGAAGAPSSFDLLETTVLGSSASSVTFSSIDQSYKHLQIRMVSRNSGDTTSPTLRFNSDSGANYATHRLYGFGESVTSGAVTGDPSMALIAFRSNSLSSTTDFGAGIVDILDYTNTSKNTTIRGLGGREQGNGSTSDFVVLLSGVWLNTSAVTSITLSTNTYQAGSRFSLYGIK